MGEAESGDLVVRRATTADVSAIGQLLDDFNREYDDPTPGPAVLAERIGRLLGSDETVIMLGGPGPDGLAVLRFRPAFWSAGLECYLAELYVVPARRGQGLGRRLMECALDQAGNWAPITWILVPVRMTWPPGRCTRASASPTVKAGQTGRSTTATKKTSKGRTTSPSPPDGTSVQDTHQICELSGDLAREQGWSGALQLLAFSMRSGAAPRRLSSRSPAPARPRCRGWSTHATGWPYCLDSHRWRRALPADDLAHRI